MEREQMESLRHRHSPPDKSLNYSQKWSSQATVTSKPNKIPQKQAIQISSEHTRTELTHLNPSRKTIDYCHMKTHTISPKINLIKRPIGYQIQLAMVRYACIATILTFIINQGEFNLYQSCHMCFI